MAGLLDPQPQPYGLLGDIRQYTGLPSRAISGLLDWYQSQPSVADRMASEYQGGLSAMDAAGQGLPERLKALAAYKHLSPETAALAMDFGGFLGNIAGKGLPGLPMDEASRMARAREIGFDLGNPLYHATKYDFNEFVPSSWRGASFFADTPEGAVRGAASGGMEHPALSGPTVKGAESGGVRIMPVVAKGKISGQDPLPAEWFPETITYGQWRKEIDGGWKSFDHPTFAGMSDKEKEVARFLRREALDNYTEAVPQSEWSKYAGEKEGLMPLALERPPTAAPIGYESFEGVGHSSSFGEAYRSLLQKLGYAGARVSDESGIATAIFDPKNIRSRFAAFDPAKADSADLLAGILPFAIGAGLLASPEDALAAP